MVGWPAVGQGILGQHIQPIQHIQHIGSTILNNGSDGSDAIIRTRGAMLSFVIDWLCVAQEHVDVVHQIQACSIHIVREQVLRSYWALLFHHIKLVVCADSPHQTGRVC